MKSAFLRATLLCIVILIVGSVRDALGWGFWAHKEIHRRAMELLPAELNTFFKHHADSIIARSIEPDLRRSKDTLEGFFHFIDIDRYGPYPFKDLPRSYDAAVQKFGKAMVDSTGTVPWRIADFTARLTKAFKEKNQDDILFYASNLGHYVADLNVPLHSTENYDGQLTNQKGIHSRWESGIPERFGKSYSYVRLKMQYIADPLAHAFETVLATYPLVDTLLQADKGVQASVPDSLLFREVQRRADRVYTDLYFERYHRALNGMVERRIRASVQEVASYWYTAWVNAGKPNLKF